MMTNENIEDTLDNEGMPVPNVWVELEGEFLDFDKDNQTLKCKFPVRDRYFNPLPTTLGGCLLYTSPSPRDATTSRMPSSA